MLKKLPLVAAVGTLAVALPATALSASHSNKCNTHTVSYVAQGKYVSSSSSLTASGSWSGTVTLKLQSANHHFTQATNLKVKGASYTFTITGAKAKFGKGVRSPATTRDHITVTGTVTEFSGKCTAATPTIKIRSISVSK